MDTVSFSQPPLSTVSRRVRSPRVLALAAGIVLVGGPTLAVCAASSASPAQRAAANPISSKVPANLFGATQQSQLTSCDHTALTAGFQNDAFRITDFGLTPPLLTFTCVYGTVNAVSSSALTVRTLDGTVNVTRGAMTLYDSAGTTISGVDVKVGEVIGVRPVRTLFHPPGQLDAQAITVEMDTFFGRVQSVRGSILTIVTGLGRLATVATSRSTRYTAHGSAAVLHDVAPGALILAQGHQTGLTTLAASRIIIG